MVPLNMHSLSNAMWWKSPFNKVVRSKEALIIGCMAGLLIGGVIGSFLISTVIKSEVYVDPIKLCEGLNNVETVTFSFTGALKKVECKDSRIFDEDDF